jgi:hypothetical protein
MDRFYESRDHGWLSIHSGLAAMGQRGRSEAQEVIVIAWREGGSSGFLPIAPLGGEAVEMVTRRCSTKVVGGAPMGRWLWVQGGEIGAGGGCGG